MQTDIEVIDVEEFHENLQRKSLDDLKRKNKKLKEENQKLDTKIYHLHHANDALSHKLFEQDQRRNELARRLGFESVESAQASITSEDPWVPGVNAAPSEARAQIFLLEGELVKHIAAGEEAQSVIAETKEQLERAYKHLDEALADTMRLREERDSARREAERQAIEASKWRIEAQTTLPEMRILSQKHQQDNEALLVSCATASTGNEAITPRRLEHNPSPSREAANATSHSTIHSSPPSLVTAHEARRYKEQFELLKAQYNALRETKEKITKKFCEQLVRWKKLKHWLVKDDVRGGRKMSMRRRFSTRRKVMEEIGPQMVLQDMALGDSIMPAAQDRAVGSPEVILINPINDRSILYDNGAADQFHHHPTHSPVCSPVKFDPKDFLAPPPNMPRFEESLTQPSSVPASQHPTATGPTPAPHSSHISQDSFTSGNDIPLSQQSLTQLSSEVSPSPVRALVDMLHAITREGAPPRVFVVDSPPREVTVVKQEVLVIKNEETPPQNTTNQRIASLTSSPETPVLIRTSHTLANCLFQRQRPKIVQPVSEPPLANTLSHPSPANVQAIRRTSTVLVMDTPCRASSNTLVRHHSSPPDSPHLQRMKKRKRNAADMGETDNDDKSDPFKSGSSTDKLLTKNPHKAYMAGYMQFKGRGRYSNAHAAADKTVNGKFVIDPDKNGGLDFQYDAVVRDKDERRRLEAGDCECCRDYYEAIGPLPPRLQAPLWKSPSSDSDPSQHAARPCRYENNHIHNKMAMSSPSVRKHIKAVEDHKHSISRHRHNWAPPKTPPDFWKIEFPDTPTVNDINRRADEMHAHKLRRVEAEANSINGRYRKRT